MIEADKMREHVVSTSEADPAALDVRDLYVSFHRRGRDLPVLRGVSVHIGAGETYGLVGESGCGKTTLVLAVVRYLARNGSVDAGSISVDGDDVLAFDEESLRKWRGERVSMVYQDPASALNPSMRVGDQLAEVFAITKPCLPLMPRIWPVKACSALPCPTPVRPFAATRSSSPVGSNSASS